MNIVLSGNLRRYTGFDGEVELSSNSIGDALTQLVGIYPDLEPIVFDGDKNLRSVHRLYLNGDVLETVDPGQTLNANDELGILTAIAGG